jgi:hypothetical protein
MSEHESTRFVLHPHAARRMRFCDISALDIWQVLEDYETRRLAHQLPHLDYRSEIFVGMVRGRRLRVYVMQGSDPPYIMTVAWEKR